MTKWKRKLFLIFLVFMGMNVFGYLYWGKTILNINQKSFRSYLGDNSSAVKQSYKIDNYRITQEESGFDKDTGLGYCCLSFEKKNGRVEGTIFANELKSEGIGEDNRFVIAVNASKSIEYERNGNKIFAYIKYSKDTGYDEPAVHVYDYGNVISDSYNDGEYDEDNPPVYIQEYTPELFQMLPKEVCIQ